MEEQETPPTRLRVVIETAAGNRCERIYENSAVGFTRAMQYCWRWGKGGNGLIHREVLLTGRCKYEPTGSRFDMKRGWARGGGRTSPWYKYVDVAPGSSPSLDDQGSDGGWRYDLALRLRTERDGPRNVYKRPPAADGPWVLVRSVGRKKSKKVLDNRQRAG